MAKAENGAIVLAGEGEADDAPEGGGIALPFRLKSKVETWEEKRERFRQDNLLECRQICIFAVFLFVFTFAMLLEQSAASSRLADHVRAKLADSDVPLGSVVGVDSLYHYLDRVFIPAVFENNTDTILAYEMSGDLHPVDVANRLLGTARLRQVRVKYKDACQVEPLFVKYTLSCYPSMFAGDEAKDSFGPELKFEHSSSAGSEYSGELGTYGPNGYVELLPTNATAAKHKLQDLKSEGYLGDATRALFVDFAVFSVNTGTYAVATIMFEFGASGQISQQLDVLTMAQSSLAPGGLGSTDEWLSFGGIVIVTLFVLWFVIEEIQEVMVQQLDYLRDGWNWIDWTNNMVQIVAISQRFILFAEAGGTSIGSAELGNKETFESYRPLADRVKAIRLLHALNAVLLWGKVIKYLRHMPIIRGLLRTVWASVMLMLPFMVMFLVGFMGFAVSYNIGFGDKIKELSTVFSAFVYLCRAFLMDVKLMPAYDAEPMFGALAILLFYVVLLLVGVNVIFAIIADSLFTAKYDMLAEDKRLAEKALHEGEPVEELLREVKKRVLRFLRLYLPPRIYRRLVKSRKVAGGPAEERSRSKGGSKPRGAIENGGGTPALEDQKRKNAGTMGPRAAALTDQAPSMSGYGDSDDEEEEEDDGYNLPTKDELMRAIEHMSGRILSEISIVGIEIKSELHDVCERVAQMQMAVEELTWRSDKVRQEQEQAGA